MPEDNAQAEAAEATQAAAPAAAKRGKGKLLLLAGGGLVLVLGGAAAWSLGLVGSAPEAGASKETAKAPEPDVGALQPLDPFIANLADEDGKRYLKATLQVEFFGASVPEDFAARLPQMRDLLLTLFTSKTFAEVRTPQGKGILRDEIINRMNRALHKDLVKAVYFTEFIVQ
jgi:flagellar FliL protein